MTQSELEGTITPRAKTERKTLLVAERMNLGRAYPRWTQCARERPAEWFILSCDLGAYRTKFPACASSRKRLESLGLAAFIEDETITALTGACKGEEESCEEMVAHRLNFLPPAECGAWDEELAQTLSEPLNEFVIAGEYTHVAVLGKRVARALLGHSDFDFFDDWQTRGRELGTEIIRGQFVDDVECPDVRELQTVLVTRYAPVRWMCVPHPSGRSHWWNNPCNVARGREEVERWLESL